MTKLNTILTYILCTCFSFSFFILDKSITLTPSAAFALEFSDLGGVIIPKNQTDPRFEPKSFETISIGTTKARLASKAFVSNIVVGPVQDVSSVSSVKNSVSSVSAEIKVEQSKLVSKPKVKSPIKTAVKNTPNYYQGNLEELIHQSCHKNGCIGEQLIRVMYCESGGRSNAVNGIHKGIFQFNPNTFKANSKRAGLEAADIWNPEHQVQVASWMFGNDQAWQWSCK